MANTTVRDFAETVGIPAERLLAALKDAGLEGLQADEPMTDDDKSTLLSHLRTTHGKRDDDAPGPRQITLKRKSHSQIRLPGGGAARGSRGSTGSRTVNVEVRKKRTYVKRSVVEAEHMERDAQVLQEAL